MRTALRACDLGLGQAALAEQDQRQFVGGDKVVGVERDDAADQRLGRARLALGLADFVQHGERARPVGRQFQHVEAEPFGGLVGALAVRLKRALHQRHQVARGGGGRQGAELQVATAHGPQATAAVAQGGDGGVHGVAITDL